jgi:hypothetical protein
MAKYLVINLFKDLFFLNQKSPAYPTYYNTMINRQRWHYDSFSLPAYFGKRVIFWSFLQKTSKCKYQHNCRNYIFTCWVVYISRNYDLLNVGEWQVLYLTSQVVIEISQYTLVIYFTGVSKICQHFEISYSRYANKYFITGVYITINDSYR